MYRTDRSGHEAWTIYAEHIRPHISDDLDRDIHTEYSHYFATNELTPDQFGSYLKDWETEIFGK